MADTEHTVAKSSELSDGQMKQVKVGDTKILLVRLEGQFHAVGSTCPHAGASLAEGVLCGDRVVCPWHKSCFSVTSGELLEPPTLDDLPRFNVRVSGDDVLVSVPSGNLDNRTPTMVAADLKADVRTFVILGSGAAGNFAAQTLRHAGFQGQIVMLGLEDRVPYNRPNLSKQYLAGKTQAESMPLRPTQFYEQHGIERLNRRVVMVDADAKEITFAEGPSMRYDALLLATGSRARTLDVPGSDLNNVFTLRTYEDADRIIAAAKPGARVVVIGSSFISMETAASLTQRQLGVTVVTPSAPFEKVLGTVGEMLQKLHEKHGVRFLLGAKVSRFEGERSVRSVTLESGEQLDADVVVVGIGVRPATDYLRGVKLNPDGGVPVDKYLRAADNLYAAGDIAAFPDPQTGKSIRIEHWRVAEQHGRVAAYNMSGQTMEFDGVPFFWTNHFGLRVDYVGHADEWDEMIVDGDISKPEFIAYYVKDDRVLAAAGCKRDKLCSALAELMRINATPKPSDLRGGGVDLVSLLPLSGGLDRISSFSLNAYQWKNRVLLVFAPSEQSPAYKTQMQLFEGQKTSFGDQDLLLVQVLAEGESRVDDQQIDEASVTQLCDRFGVSKAEFSVILVGKDGTEKRRDDVPVQPTVIFNQIDTMFMRQREMRERSR